MYVESTKRICIVAHSSAKGGAELALIELIDVLLENGFKIFVVLPSVGPFEKELQKRYINYIIIFSRWWVYKIYSIIDIVKFINNNFLSIINIIKYIKKHNCKIVITNTSVICVGGVAAKLLKINHIWCIHEFVDKGLEQSFFLGNCLSYWIMDKLSNILIVHSNILKNELSKYIPSSKLTTLYQPVLIRNYLSPKSTNNMSHNKQFNCLMLGTINNIKRQEDAIIAISILMKYKIDINLTIIGACCDDYINHLMNLISMNRLREVVSIIGYVDNPINHINKADVVLTCSKCEGFGRVTIEAMKAGKPVIGSRSCGTKELIIDGFNGLYYSPLNQEDLAEKIKFLYENPEIAKEIGLNAQYWANNKFNLENYNKDVVRIFNHLMI